MDIINRAARLDEADALGIRTQLEYERLLDLIASVRLAKVATYGESRYKEDDVEFNLWTCYSDVFRKHVRLRKLTSDSARAGKPSAELIDTYLDIANYALMALQLLGVEEDHYDKI